MSEPPWIVVPIAIRDGETVRMHFPADLTPAEAEKVARVIRAYAVETTGHPAQAEGGGDG